MGSILLPPRWQSQPQYDVPIEWGHPLARGLVFETGGHRLDGVSCHDQVSGNRMVVSSNITAGTDQYGRTIKFPGTHSANKGAFGEPLGTDNNTESTWQLIFRNSTANADLFSRYGNSTATQSWSIRTNATATGFIWFAAQESGGSAFRRRWDAANVISTTEINHVVLSWRGGASASLWVNGINRSSALSVVSSVATVQNDIAFQIAIGVSGNSAVTMTGSVGLARMWKRGFSDAECKSISDNPWQILRLRPRRLYILADLGAPPITPQAGVLALVGSAPGIAWSSHQGVGPQAGVLLLVGTAPTVARTAHQWVAPDAGLIALAGPVPTVAFTANQAAAPEAGTLAITGTAPTVDRTAHQGVEPAGAVLALIGTAPTVDRSAHQATEPAAGELALVGGVALVEQSSNTAAAPEAGVLALAGGVPSIALSEHRSVAPDAGTLALAGTAPGVFRSVPQEVLPAAGVVAIQGPVPDIGQAPVLIIQPAAGAVAITGAALSVAQSDVIAILPEAGQIIIVGGVPLIDRSGHLIIQPEAGVLTLAGMVASITQRSAMAAGAIPADAVPADRNARPAAHPGMRRPPQYNATRRRN